MDNKMPMRVCGMEGNNITEASKGAKIGTLVTA
jgi:hypothetical protein